MIDSGDGTLKLNVFSESVHTDDMRLVECPQLLSSTETLVGLLGTGAQDGHLDFHTAPEL